MVNWKQCPYCARWFIANHGKQIYDSKKCRNSFNSKLNRLRMEKEKTNYHYMSKGGEMYDRKIESRY